jgi:hypothetical protein
MLTRRALLAALGFVGTSAATASALPTGGTYFPFGHKQSIALTTALRLGELEQLKAAPEDEAYDRSEFYDALAVLSKYGCTGVILPDEVIESHDKRRNLAPYGVEFFKRGELLKSILSKPVS